MNENLTKGDKVFITTSEGRILEGTYVKPTGRNGYHEIKTPEGAYTRKLDKIKKEGDVSTNFIAKAKGEIVEPKSKKASQQFSINERFSFMSNMVRMVIKGSAVSLIITGEGGLGKTFTVMQEFDKKKLERDDDYLVIKGYSSARGLYRTLYENQDKMIIFDDCDKVLENDISIELLKGALDSYDKRIINWVINKDDGELPSSFEFTGRIIFISNKSQDDIAQAILSRCMSVDLSMSPEDKIERMQNILPNLKTAVSMKLKQECLDLIKEHKDECMDLNMRTLLKVIGIRTDDENGEDWKKMAIYAMTSSVS